MPVNRTSPSNAYSYTHAYSNRRSTEPATVEPAAQDSSAYNRPRFNAPPTNEVTGKGDVGGTYTKEQRRDYDPDRRGAYDYRPVSTGQELGRVAIARTINDTGDDKLIQQDEFEIIKHEDTDGDGDHDYTIVLAGVTDLSSQAEALGDVGNRHLDIGLNPDNYTVRDTDQFAIPSSRSASVDDNRYAQMVKEYVMNNVPEGANVMIVGHSYGADTALDLASDPEFNNSTSGVNVTHVVAAAYFSQPQLSEVQNHTDVLVLQNTEDLVVIAEAAGHTLEGAAGLPGDVVRQGRDTAGDLFDLGESILNKDPIGVFSNDVTRGALDPSLPSRDDLTPDAFDLFDDGVTTPADNIVVARFRGGVDGGGHKQNNYTEFVNGNDEVATNPAIEAFYESVADAGYAGKGERWAIDISIPNGEDHEVYYPGQSRVEQAREIWDRVPGSDVVGGVIGDAGRGAKDAFDTVDVVIDQRDVIIDAAKEEVTDFGNDIKDGASQIGDYAEDFASSAWDKATFWS